MTRPRLPEIREHPPFFGPVFITVLVIAGYLLWRHYTGNPVEMPTFARKTIVQREVAPGNMRDGTPTPDYILQHLKDMDLPGKTKDALEQLSRKSAKELQPLKTQVDRQTNEFRAYMDQRQREGRTPMGDIKRKMNQADDAMLRADAAVRRFWHEAGSSLTPEQKAEVERKYRSDKQKAK